MSPRSPPQRRYSRRNSHDNGRRRSEMCHGFDRHWGDGRLGSTVDRCIRKKSVIADTLARINFIVIIVKDAYFDSAKNRQFIFGILKQEAKIRPKNGHEPEPPGA